MTYTDFSKEVLNIIKNHQNVGWNRQNKPFLDKEEAFNAIVNLAISNCFIVLNYNNGMYKDKGLRDCIDTKE
jgi:hypothetical protein